MNTNRISSPKLSFYHPKKDGSGSALHIKIYPADRDGEGAAIFRLSPQKPVAKSTDFAQFDDENGWVERLDFTDVCKFIQVLRGETESINVGLGLLRGHGAIRFYHDYASVGGNYVLEVRRRVEDGKTDSHRFIFTAAEALGLAIALEGSLFRIAFGNDADIADSASEDDD